MLCTAVAISAGHWAGHWAGIQLPAPSPALYGQLHSVPHSNTLIFHRTAGALLPPPTELRALQIWVCVCVLSSFPEHHEYLGEEDEH